MTTIVTCFGEIMARIQPEGFNRIRQGFPGHADISFAGTEANVAVSLQMMGRDSRYATVLPVGSLGDAALDSVRRFGVDTRFVLRTNGRLGLYFVERGANQRPSNVIYDRAGSAVCLAGPDAYAWDKILNGSNWLHITGITPAISRKASEAVLLAVQEAKKKGLTVSCDLNFRKKLWDWEPGTPPNKLAEKVMRGLMPHVDVVIGNEEDTSDIFGISAAGTDVEKGDLAIERYPDVASQVIRLFPNVSKVAITLRQSLSASHNNWGAMLYDAASKSAVFAPRTEGVYSPYQIRNIVDRIGAGDSFAAGLIFACTDAAMANDPQSAISYAAAASCLSHSIEGDFNYVSQEEIFALMKGEASGRVKR
ncbi:MAG: sugar kinase [Spirochaetia bacterium]|jgi:2-dehydro-3-deoxygluconokinase